MRPAEILSEAASPTAAARGSHDVCSFGRLHVVGFTAAAKGNNDPSVGELKTKCWPVKKGKKNLGHQPGGDKGLVFMFAQPEAFWSLRVTRRGGFRQE